jgi:alpha-mannosidase
LPGTATPKAFEFAWNDDVLAMNQFAGVLLSASDAVAAALDTQVKGTAVVVYNPLGLRREDVVEATVSLPAGTAAVRVVGPDGKAVPAQLVSEKDGRARILFVAAVPSAGYAVYDVQTAPAAPAGTLKVTESSLENSRYRLRVDANGDIASLFDKTVGKELLSGPARLALHTEKPFDWPAWNMDWADRQKPARAHVHAPAQTRRGLEVRADHPALGG